MDRFDPKDRRLFLGALDENVLEILPYDLYKESIEIKNECHIIGDIPLFSVKDVNKKT